MLLDVIRVPGRSHIFLSQLINNLHLLWLKLEFENIKVLLDSLQFGRFGDGDYFPLERPSYSNLCLSHPLLLCQCLDIFIFKNMAFCEWTPALNTDILLSAVLYQLVILNIDKK